MSGKKPENFWRKVRVSYQNSVLLAANQPSAVPSKANFPSTSSGSSGVELPCSSRYKSIQEYLHVSENIQSFDPEDNPVHSVTSLKCKLQLWAVRNRVKHSALSSLLKILREEGYNDLPSDARTLLRTPRALEVVPVPPGQYCHIGLKRNLERLIEHHGASQLKKIKLQVNVDGLPLAKSTGLQFWPILGYAENIPDSSPFVIGVYCGDNKPESSKTLLQPFVDEALYLLRDSCLCSGTVGLEITSLICDAPARSFLLNTKGHTGYYGCGKCEQEGDFVENRTVFLEVNARLRTNQSFRNQTQKEHHHGPTELLRLPIDLVKDVPFEFQHLVCLGVTRKLLNLLTKGKCGPYKLSARLIHLLSSSLINLRPFIPVEFSRKPRSLTFLPRWKATEYRQFVLYTGPIVLKDVLPVEYYNHFMCFHVAVYILCSVKFYRRLNEYAHELLVHFVSTFSTLYGPEQVSYNVHGLVHLAADALRHGPLDFYSTFKFENHLGQLKSLLRSTARPLQQVVYRLEENGCLTPDKKAENYVEFLQLNTSKDSRHQHYKAAKFKNFTLKTKIAADSFCKLKNNSILKIIDLFVSGGKKYCTAHSCRVIGCVYETPCDSSAIGIVRVELVTNRTIQIDADSVETKILAFPLNDNFYACFQFVSV